MTRIHLMMTAIIVAIAGVAMPSQSQIVSFEGIGADGWDVVNDGVMGGRSSSSIVLSGDGTAVFSGNLSLENSGGFASVRTPVATRIAEGADGIEFRVRGDGRTYQVRFRTDRRFDGMAYRASFETTRDEWTLVRIPFSAFEPTFRGRVLSDVPPLDPSAVKQLSLMLADKSPGEFRLRIGAIATWNAKADERTSP